MVLCRNKGDTSPGRSLNLLKVQFDHISRQLNQNELLYRFAFLVIFHAFLASDSADFFNISFFEKSFRNTIRVSNSMDPDQDQQSVGPDLGQTVCKGCLSRQH